MENSENEVHEEANDTSYNVGEISEVKQRCGVVVISIKSMLEELPPVNTECNIYRVPKLLRQMNQTAYAPQVISIGPFHHPSKNLKATEQYKLQGLHNFLRRIEKEKSLDDLVEIAQSWVKEARNCYAEPIRMNDEEFVMMMLVDGCFIVEFFILVHDQYTTSVGRKFPKIQPNVDLLFYQGIIPDVYLDLIKLENQVPFFLLQHLFDLIPKKDTPNSLIVSSGNSTTTSFLELTFEVLRLGWVEKYVELGEILVLFDFRPRHLVDFLRFYYITSQKDECSEKKKKNLLSFFPVHLCHLWNKKPHEESNDQKKKNNFLNFYHHCLRPLWNEKPHEESSAKQGIVSKFKRFYVPDFLGEGEE